MKLSRIDHIALNGGDGQHYKYEEVADRVAVAADDLVAAWQNWTGLLDFKATVLKILVESFPNDEA